MTNNVGDTTLQFTISIVQTWLELVTLNIIYSVVKWSTPSRIWLPQKSYNTNSSFLSNSTCCRGSMLLLDHSHSLRMYTLNEITECGLVFTLSVISGNTQLTTFFRLHKWLIHSLPRAHLLSTSSYASHEQHYLCSGRCYVKDQATFLREIWLLVTDGPVEILKWPVKLKTLGESPIILEESIEYT